MSNPHQAGQPPAQDVTPSVHAPEDKVERMLDAITLLEARISDVRRDKELNGSDPHSMGEASQRLRTGAEKIARTLDYLQGGEAHFGSRVSVKNWYLSSLRKAWAKMRTPRF